jgi:hypothetical protein
MITLSKGVKTIDSPSREHVVFYPHIWVAKVEELGRSAMLEWRMLMMEASLHITGISAIQLIALRKAFEFRVLSISCIHTEDRSLENWETGWFLMESIMGLLALAAGGHAALETFTSTCKEMWSKKVLEWPEIKSKNAGGQSGQPFRRKQQQGQKKNKKQQHQQQQQQPKPPNVGYSQGPRE